MAGYAWIITHVNTKELGTDWESEVGVAGPRDASEEHLLALKAGQGATFRMLDDDGIWYYRGRLIFDDMTDPQLSKHSEPERKYYICAGMGGDEEQEFGPLNDFGMPNAGCTEIHFRCDDPTTIDGGRPARVWAIL